MELVERWIACGASLHFLRVPILVWPSDPDREQHCHAFLLTMFLMCFTLPRHHEVMSSGTPQKMVPSGS